MFTSTEFAGTGRVDLRELRLAEQEREGAPAARIAYLHPPKAETRAPGPHIRKPPVNVLLIDSRSLFREGIKIMLRHSSYSVATEADSVALALSRAPLATSPQLVIYGLHLDAMEGSESLNALRKAFPESRLVVQADPSIEPAFVLESFQLGIDAWLTLNVSSAVLIGSLDLVMSGERIFPAAAILGLAGKAMTSRAFLIEGAKNPESLRDARILSCLAAGHSNKMIAHELNVTHGTVKALLRALFQKIGVANRTQAAVWAIGRKANVSLNGA
ncbi:MAG TPA: response regulator transcription factor [Alphaproteobacteria bacterium]|nr:response regulator transcription factor [Alphaproteobacteria bacterium]